MGKFTTSDGAKLNYELRGRDKGLPPLVFIHGWCSNLTHWRYQVEYFARNHKVLCIDRRGQGKSTTPGTGHNAEQHAQDIAAVVKSCGLKNVIAIGHAGGGPGTLAFLSNFPRLVKAGVMIDSGMYPLPRLNNPKSPFGMTLGSMLQSLQSSKGEAAFKTMYASYFGKKCDPKIASEAVQQAASTPMPIIQAELRGMAASTQKLAEGIAKPVLWLTATAVDQDYISKHLKKVSFAQTVGSGHFPQLEVPGQVNAMIETFCDQL
ncbi:MAG: alpha/beta hydrolase [Gammaproteobacteria bacterium]|jgi:pimeloyl-ACP methyl ester carboxylesterase|nr:alpha/beta hydrolase [Gammaproteobacteria bacterium]MBT3866992.1 alpha/beta hydrolase [Gammaproteobacteria bacterium]MBT4380310.1 alpha/beta hydrolase [Gammaproteobacteria bacterium]MBT4618924.1 alpha/beta hydrolase [Gammaproteobacteria bacterium]MBT5199128.1 alpha/beta hydrolase [Gammaproteobacteria bacterium]